MMKPVGVNIAICAAVWIMLSMTAVVSAQVMGPLLPESAMEVGLGMRWVEVDLERGAETSYIDQYDVSIPARYGVTRFATLSAEMFVGTEDTHSIETALRYYKLGGGFQALVWEKGDYVVSGGVHFSETLLIDRSGEVCDHGRFTLAAIMQAQRTFDYRHQEITVWGGGVQYYFKYSPRRGNGCGSGSWNNAQTLGAAVGANVLLFDHLQFYYHFVYVEYYQPRFGVAFRF